MRDARIRSYEASAAIGGRRIVAGSGSGALVRVAAAATDKIIGVAERTGFSGGQMADVIVDGPVEVLVGGNVSAFDPITANAQGKAVKAVPVAGQVVRVVGFIQADAVDGDFALLVVAPSLLATPA